MPLFIRFSVHEKLLVPVRIVENFVLGRYHPLLHPDIYMCVNAVPSYYMTESEAKVLNEMNSQKGFVYGREPFNARKDYMVLLNDVEELLGFLEMCYKRLVLNVISCDYKCGFLILNSQDTVSYYIVNGQKYVPLFYFGNICLNSGMVLETRILTSWDLAYLKFCFTLQGIRSEFIVQTSCVVAKFDDIKNYMPPDTCYREFWPQSELISPPSDSSRPKLAPIVNFWYMTPNWPLLNSTVPVSTATMPVQVAPVLTNNQSQFQKSKPLINSDATMVNQNGNQYLDQLVSLQLSIQYNYSLIRYFNNLMCTK